MRRLKKLILAWKFRRQVRESLSTLVETLSGGGGADALGGLTSEESDALCEEVKRLPNGASMVEFGTLFGFTTRRLAAAAPQGVKIVTVDNFCWNPFGMPPVLHRGMTQRVLEREIADGRVELVESDSRTFRADAARQIPAMVFFDADHGYEAVREEIEWARTIGVKIICGHDYGNRSFGVTRAVDEAFPKENVRTVGMVWIARV